jgi:hypothetical protein
MESSTWASRAVTRRIEPGNAAYCSACNGLLAFRATQYLTQIIANVYVDGEWDHVEHYHPEHYGDAGQPYGDPTSGNRVP